MFVLNVVLSEVIGPKTVYAVGIKGGHQRVCWAVCTRFDSRCVQKRSFGGHVEKFRPEGQPAYCIQEHEQKSSLRGGRTDDKGRIAT